MEQVTHKGGRGSTLAAFQDSVMSSHGCSALEPTTVMLRAGSQISSPQKPCQPTFCDSYLPLFTTSEMVKWQNTVFYNTSNIWPTTKRILLLEQCKKSVISWSASQVKMQSNLLPRLCWLLKTFQTFS